MNMKLKELNRESLLELSKKKIYLEGTILKVLQPDEDDNELIDYLKKCKEKDTLSRKKRLDVTKQVQNQYKELEVASKENEQINKQLSNALDEASKSEKEAHRLREVADKARAEAEKLRDEAMEDLDSLQRRTQFELMGKIVKVALIVILGVGILTTLLYFYTLVYDVQSAIIESTWSNLFGILLTNSFSIIGTIMGVKYATEKE
jgi:Fe2+ transport system protein B